MQAQSEGLQGRVLQEAVPSVLQQAPLLLQARISLLPDQLRSWLLQEIARRREN